MMPVKYVCPACIYRFMLARAWSSNLPQIQAPLISILKTGKTIPWIEIHPIFPLYFATVDRQPPLECRV